MDAFGSSVISDHKADDKFDPFGLEGRQSVPLPLPSHSLSLKSTSKFKSGRASAPISSDLPSEDQQLAWAARESLRAEEERRKRLEREDAELEMALKLSTIELNKK